MLDQYEIKRTIGEGGSGVVLEALQIQSERTVAIKMLSEAALYDEASLQRLKREAKLTCSLDHPNIVKVYSFGISEDSRPYFVMEFLSGKTLSQIFKEGPRLSLERFDTIFSQICSALDYAHKQGVVHRDIKPSNIILSQEGDGVEIAKILDFGIARQQDIADATGARITKTGALVGSPAYMSPEQCKGAPPDTRSDIYAVGCVMYEALCGKTPFGSDNSVDILMMHLNTMPPNMGTITKGLELPPSLVALVMSCLSKSPDARPQTAAELRERLQKACEDTPQKLAESDGSSKNKMLVATIVVSALILISGAVLIPKFMQANSPVKNKSDFVIDIRTDINKADALQHNGDFVNAAKRYASIGAELKKFLKDSTDKDALSFAKSNIYYCSKNFVRCVFQVNGFDPKALENWRTLLADAIKSHGESSLEAAEAKYQVAKLLLQEKNAGSSQLLEAEHLLKASISTCQSKIQIASIDPVVNYGDEKRSQPQCLAYAGENLIAAILIKQGKYTEAIVLLKKLLNQVRDPSEDDYAEYLMVHVRLCRALTLKGDGKAALAAREALFEELNTTGVSLTDALNVLGNLFDFYLGRNDLKSAQQVLNQIQRTVDTTDDMSKTVSIAKADCYHAKLSIALKNNADALKRADKARTLLGMCTSKQRPLFVWAMLAEIYGELNSATGKKACMDAMTNLQKSQIQAPASDLLQQQSADL